MIVSDHTSGALLQQAAALVLKRAVTGSICEERHVEGGGGRAGTRHDAVAMTVKQVLLPGSVAVAMPLPARGAFPLGAAGHSMRSLSPQQPSPVRSQLTMSAAHSVGQPPDGKFLKGQR